MSLDDLLFPHRVVPKATQRLRHRINVLSDESDDLDPRGDHRDSRLRRSEDLANKRNQTLRAHKKIQDDPERKAKRLAYTNKWRKDNPERVRENRRRHNAKETTKLYKRVWRKAHYQHLGIVHGEKHFFAKMSADKVREMRAMYEAGGVSIKALGARYGVSFAAARKIIKRETWRHVE